MLIKLQTFIVFALSLFLHVLISLRWSMLFVNVVDMNMIRNFDMFPHGQFQTCLLFCLHSHSISHCWKVDSRVCMLALDDSGGNSVVVLF